jgi:hypothetical protein
MRDRPGRGSCTRSAVRSMCDVFFPNLPPALSRGLGAFPVPCGLSPPAERFGALTPPAVGRSVRAFPVVLWQRVGPGIPGPFACAYRYRDRPPGVDAPARWAHSAGAGLKPIWVGHLPMAGCPLCGRLFPPPPRPPAVGPAPSWCEGLQIAAPPSPASSRSSASTAGVGGGEPKWQSSFSLLWPSPPSSGAQRP